MAEDAFERDMGALFAQAPVLPDADDFAAKVEMRAAADQRVRRLALAAAAGVGGVLGLWPLATSDLPRQAGRWTAEGWAAIQAAQAVSPTLTLTLALAVAMAAASFALAASRDA